MRVTSKEKIIPLDAAKILLDVIKIPFAGKKILLDATTRHMVHKKNSEPYNEEQATRRDRQYYIKPPQTLKIGKKRTPCPCTSNTACFST
jgi:hypothetical protein